MDQTKIESKVLSSENKGSDIGHAIKDTAKGAKRNVVGVVRIGFGFFKGVAKGVFKS